MKKVYAFTFCLLLLLLLGFYLFGDALYALNKPEVATARVAGEVGSDVIFVSQKALCRGPEGDYVFLLRSEQGFSRTIYTVSQIQVTVLFEDYDRERIALAPDKRLSGRVVLPGDVNLNDGMRVVLAGG